MPRNRSFTGRRVDGPLPGGGEDRPATAPPDGELALPTHCSTPRFSCRLTGLLGKPTSLGVRLPQRTLRTAVRRDLTPSASRASRTTVRPRRELALPTEAVRKHGTFRNSGVVSPLVEGRSSTKARSERSMFDAIREARRLHTPSTLCCSPCDV